ncbi:MAG: hypothetical protein ACR2OI_02210 [Acidimicrobiia bacterium]
MRFTQTMAIRTTDGAALGSLMSAWHEAEAGVAPGYLGSRLLADRDDPGRFLIVVDFSSAEEAEINSNRPETAEWASRMMDLVDGDVGWGNYDVAHVVG